MKIILAAAGIATTQMTAAENMGSTLPFSVNVTEEKFENLPDYMSNRNPVDMDFPYNPVMIDGEFWVMYKNGYRGPVFRFKGSNIENAVRQPDGSASFPVRAPYILGGMWYNAQEKKLYAPMHCEVARYAGIVEREIHLATSLDKGLTWKYEGALLASNDPKNPRKSPTESSGLQFDGGDGDYIIYADERGGYIYLYTSHYVQVKIGAPGQAFLRHRVARCAIADKMAPGKWMKFYEGAWREPGVGGKASYINAFTVTYNTYLKKYLSFNYMSGISYCDDLSKQDWSPSFHVGKAWGIDGTWGYWATNADKNDTITSGETIFVYSFWQNQQGRRFRVDLGKGETPPRLGFASPALYLINPVTASKTMTMDPGQHYGYTPFFESSDPIEARRARRVGCGGVETKYTGKWSDVSDPSYYEGKARASVENGASVEFTFKGKDIYWRAAKGPDSGKAEVYMDGVLQTTVDCWASAPTVYQFGFVKRNLSGGDHTIKVVVKNEKNPLSSGAAIKHMLFEHEADTWRASDCFSSVQGKNQWSQLQTGTSRFANLAFQDPVWKGADGSEIGYSHMIPGTSNVVRQWVAPHEGIVRIEGAPSIDGTSTHAVDARVLKNAGELWSARLGAPGKQASLHDTTVAVRKDDAIAFVVTKSRATKKAAELELDTIMEKDADDTLVGLPDPPIALPQQDKQASTVRVLWDPVVTYAATLRDRH